MYIILNYNYGDQGSDPICVSESIEKIEKKLKELKEKCDGDCYIIDEIEVLWWKCGDLLKEI